MINYLKTNRMKGENMTRREFIGSASSAAALASVPLHAGEPAHEPFAKGVFHQLGRNMWADYYVDPNQDAVRMGKKYTASFTVNEEGWWSGVDYAAKAGLNLVFIDLGEAMAFPSHPELAVPGSWSPEKMQGYLDRMRKLGLEPIPKLNFSACHDGWLKEYARMLSTRKYYEVCEDVIRDACDIFGKPRLFLLGFDEENANLQKTRHLIRIRQGELWWHDVFFFEKACKKAGARPMMWADKIWHCRKEYLSRMSKDILQSAWYYFDEFELADTWDDEFEKQGKWAHMKHGAGAVVALEEGGFDQMPCCANCYREHSVDGMVRLCKERIAAQRLKGIYIAPWARTDTEGKMYTEEERSRLANKNMRGAGRVLFREGIDQFKTALAKYGM